MNANVSIIAYQDEHHEAFRQLNLEWLDKYKLTEEPDLMVLNDPRNTILHQDGFIWVAEINSEIVGTAALIKEHPGIYELAKMSVAPVWRGKGISKLLIETCLEKAKELRAEKIQLFSNHQLMAALKLYERYGFQYVVVTDSPFATADIKMELLLEQPDPSSIARH